MNAVRMISKIQTFVILIPILFINVISIAQTIKGYIIDEANNPVSFVTISLKKDTTNVAVTVSDSAGFFQIDIIDNFPLSLQVTRVGYIALDTLLVSMPVELKLIVQKDSAILSEVTITSQQSLITRKADRYIINIQNSFLSNGYTAIDLLQKAPGLWVDNNGIIKLRGKSNITVMVNGVFQRMGYAELQDFLKTLKSENISKIEVVTNPGAEYDAENAGGFVNIILKKNKIHGLQGSVFATYRQQKQFPYISPGYNLQFRNNKLSGYLSYTFTYDQSKFYASNEVVYPDNGTYDTYTDIENIARRHQMILGLGYEISKKTTLNVQHIFSASSGKNDFLTDITGFFTGNSFTGIANSTQSRDNIRNTTTANLSINLDTLGSTVNFIGDYTQNKNTSDVFFISEYSNATADSVYRNYAPYNTKILSLQSDIKKNLKNAIEVKAGLKFSKISRNNNLLTENYIGNVWIKDNEASNDFLYNEYISAAYTSVSKIFKKTQLTIGLRGENTTANGHSLTSNEQLSNSYFRLFPSLNMQQTLNEAKGNSLYFSYNNPFTRPSYTTLNPYKLKIDNYTYQIGNPSLQPQTGYNFDAGINLNNKYNMGAYFNQVNDVFANILLPQQDNTIVYQMQNFTSSKETGIYITIPYNISKWWATNTDLQLYHLQYSLDKYTNEQTIFWGKLVQNISLGKIAKMDIVTQYTSPHVYSNTRAAYNFFTDIGFTKNLLKNKMRLRLLFSDITNTVRDKNITTFNNAVIRFYQKRPTRTISLSVSYNFSTGKNANIKRINQIANEEKNRIN
jgi:outer membrane receptor protein involved in Fe transport